MKPATDKQIRAFARAALRKPNKTLKMMEGPYCLIGEGLRLGIIPTFGKIKSNEERSRLYCRVDAFLHRVNDRLFGIFVGQYGHRLHALARKILTAFPTKRGAQ